MGTQKPKEIEVPRKPKVDPGEQLQFPGTETERNEKVHRAAVRLFEERAVRLQANKDEKTAEQNLIRIMEEEGIESYQYKNITVHIDLTKKAKVKKTVADDAE